MRDNIVIPTSELDFQFARSSGPGGQNVNKVNSKAILFWNISINTSIPKDVLDRFRSAYGAKVNSEGYVVLHSDTFRDRPKNIQLCEDKLRNMLLDVWVPPKKRKPTKPSKASQEKRVQNKKERSELKKNRKKVSY